MCIRDRFKGLLLGLFFIAVGMDIDLDRVAEEPQIIAAGVLVLLLVKFGILFLVGLRPGKLPVRSALMLGSVMWLGGEFAFVVFSEAVRVNLLEDEARDRLVAMVGVSTVSYTHLDVYKRQSVAILDVLQYLDAQGQRNLIAQVSAMLTPGARLVIRTALGDDSRRGKTSQVTDRLANLIGWMQSRPKCYPDAEAMRAQLLDSGLHTTFEPLYGRTPFHNWLIVAARPY